MSIILEYIFDKPNSTDLFFMILCLLSAIIGCLVPRTKDIFLGVSYGNNNLFINIIREGSKVIWLLSGILLMFRSVVVGIREFSFWILFLYCVGVLLVTGLGLLCNRFSEKIWHKKHHRDIIKIAFNNPIFLKILEIWKSNSFFKTIYILNDRAVFLQSPVTIDHLTCGSEEINSPVSSNENAKSVTSNVAYSWKNTWQTSFLNNNNGATSVSFSSLGYAGASDITVRQLTEILAEVLKLEKGTVEKKFELSYTSSYSYLAGMGETLHQKSERKTYSAATTVLAAGVVYKPEPITTHEEVQIKRW